MRIAILPLLVLIWLAPPVLAVEKTTPDRIRDAANQFLAHFAAERKADGQKVSYSLGTLDPRLNLAPCAGGPAVSFSSDPTKTTQPTLNVSCNGNRPWRLYLSASVEIRGKGLVAAVPLSRGDRLTEAMITNQSVIINSVRRGAITEQKLLVGMEVRRSVNAGTVFTPDIVIRPDAVERGDHVIIVARSGAIAVQSRGKALSDARIGDQVLVQNLRSAKTVRATVTAPGHVEVPM